jgi:hypothetical protein
MMKKRSDLRPTRLDPEQSRTVGRRGFLGAGAAALGLAAGAAPLLAWVKPAAADALGPQGDVARADTAFQLRVQVAQAERSVTIPPHPDNGDEARYASKIGNYTKGLPHDPVLGEVLPEAYCALLQALEAGTQEALDQVPLGCPDPAQQRKLVNPLAGLAFELEGTDSHQLFVPPAPTFASAEQAGEMVELYWMALLRDVPFAAYPLSPLAHAAAADLSQLSDFKGPKQGGVVTPATLFRGVFPGDLEGPYVSQFRYLEAPFAASFIEQRILPALPGLDFVTTFPDWLQIQNGCAPTQSSLTAPPLRFIVDGRDYAQWVHLDVSLDTYLVAFYVLRALGVPFNPGNPYLDSVTQEGFGTFGYPHGLSLLSEVATRAYAAIWFQKWFVHRRERPEDFGGRVELDQKGVTDYPIQGDLLHSPVLPLIRAANAHRDHGPGTYLLPLAYPEGSPLHPSYGEGHGVVAGACVTILKAFFDGSFVIPHPRVPDPLNPSKLVPYNGPPLTVTGELDKLASNIALARDFAGVHWRSDAFWGLKLGEAVAISILADQRPTFAEDFHGFTFTRFDGSTITV